MSSILGIIIGIVMGLTGAGGALIAIPLFITFLEMDLKEATVYSLVAVVIASLSNFIFQRRFTDYQLAFLLILFAAIGSFATNPLKKFLPDIFVAILLAIISLYSLFSVWRPSGLEKSARKKTSVYITLLVGFSLGALTTFTGLGGGVLMLPVMISIYGFEQPRAVATSLLTVALSSLSSLLIQVYSGATFMIDTDFLALILGIIVSAFMVKKLTSILSSKNLEITRKIIFTLVVIVAMTKIF